MRVFKLTGAMVIVLAFTAIATATASAAETLWTWLPGATGTKFTGSSGKATLEKKSTGKITCESSTAAGEITGEKTLALATVDFKGCTAFGLSALTLGDSKGLILVHLEIHNCRIATGSNAGLLIKPLPVHITIPSIGTLLLIEGSFVAELKPNKKLAKTFELVIAQSKGVQALEKCEGGKAETLLTSENGGAFEQSGEEAEKGTIAWTTIEQEAMA
jgi:hypothetical protein